MYLFAFELFSGVAALLGLLLPILERLGVFGPKQPMTPPAEPEVADVKLVSRDYVVSKTAHGNVSSYGGSLDLLFQNSGSVNISLLSLIWNIKQIPDLVVTLSMSKFSPKMLVPNEVFAVPVSFTLQGVNRHIAYAFDQHGPVVVNVQYEFTVPKGGVETAEGSFAFRCE